MKISLIFITYSFGTFGLLNLFGLRLAVQAVVIALVIGILLNIKISFRAIDMMFVLIFAVLFAFGGIVHGGQIAKPGEALLMVFIIISILSSPDRHVLGLAKTLVICSAFFSALVFIASIGYSLYPSQLQHANFNIYDSTTGNQLISPGSILDLFSFTSGDGFEISESTRIRLKGYSNEPSATIVHYLAPVALAFFLSGRYIYIGIFILAVNVTAISSLISLVIILGSLIAMIAVYASGKYFKHMYFIALPMILALVAQPDIIPNMFTAAGILAFDNFGFDLIARKTGGGADDASILARLSGISDGIRLLLVSPIGYSHEMLGSGAGLIYIISATTGWIGLTIFFSFIVKFVKKIIIGISFAQTYSNQYALALTMSLLIVLLLISGYGWDRPPGIVMIIILYKMIDIKVHPIISSKNR